MNPITIAAVSCMIISGSPEANLARIELWARRAAEAGADLALFNETSVTGYWMDRRIRDLAEPLDGPSVRRLHELAAELNIVLAVGLAEREGEKVYNSHILVGPQGLIGSHRKSALPSGEEKWFDIGDDAHVFDVKGRKIGVAICFESVAPDTCKALADNGAEIILAPYMNGVTAQEIAEGKRPYFLERARTNRVWYVAVDQCGVDYSEPSRLTSPGAAAFVDPDGKMVLTTSLEETGEHMLMHRIE